MSLSRAQELAARHASVTVEDVPDPDLNPIAAQATSEPPLSEQSSSYSRPAESGLNSRLDTHSHELFPELGAAKTRGGATAPIWGAKSTPNSSTTPTNGISRSSTPVSGAETQPAVNIPGRNTVSVTLDPQFVLPRAQLKKPIADVIKDINRKSRANVTMGSSTNGRLRFDATGPSDLAQQALKDLVQQIGTKTSITVPIPQSARAHIIGRGGSMIKSLQEKSGAKIQLPRVEDNAGPDDSDDDTAIDVLVEGNTLSAALARDEILKIAGQHTSNSHSKLRGIPSEFYPFIAGPRNSNVGALQDYNGVEIKIPSYHTLTNQCPPTIPTPGSRPVFTPASNEHFIQLIGERSAIQQVRAEIERQVAELHRQLALEQLSVQGGRHRFQFGDGGVSNDDFFAETGCALILPVDDDDDVVTVVGPADRVQAGLERAMDLAMSCSNMDIARLHRNAPNGAALHAQHITRYLRHRQEIDRLEKLYNIHINTPFSDEGAQQWELFARDMKNTIRAQSEIKNLISGHPPSRVTTLDVDPFYHQHLTREVVPQIQDNYGVQAIIPLISERNLPVLLVYEGPSDGEYQVPRAAPSPEEVRAFKLGLEQARQHILDLINSQEEIVSHSVEVPQKFHERLRRFIKKEQDNAPPTNIRIRVSAMGTTVILKGPRSSVERFATKVDAFLEQEKQDEKERDYTTTFDFPQKYVNHLIGKSGRHIAELKDRFDVEIKAQDGQVELKGPKAKSDAAKAHILSWLRQLADETTHVLKIEPKFHRELIGAQGGQINRLQDRYKVHIFFPRTNKNNNDDDDSSDAAEKPRRQQAPDEVLIRGPKKGADEAREEILSLLLYLKDHSYTDSVTMAQKWIPMLIGQGGAAMDELRQATGARIDVPASREAEEAEIQIRGTKEQVQAAKKLLLEKRSVLDDTVVREIEVDRKHHRTLIGANGSNLKDIVLKAGGSDNRRELSRAIQFPKQETDGNTIKVEGRTEVVDKIISQILEIVNERESQVTQIVDVPIPKHKALIGRGGDTKRKLETQFGVSIDVPRMGDGKTGVKLTGRPENVEQAEAHILELTKEQEGETVQVPRSLHHAMSNGGKLFRKLRNDYHVTVDHDGHEVPQKPSQPGRADDGGSLPLITDDADAVADAHSWVVVDYISNEDGEIPWVLRGSVEDIAKAKRAIQTAQEQASKNSSVGYLGLPDPRTYRFVVGPGGSKVNSIRKQSGCTVNVPQPNSPDEAIEVLGSRDAVEQAKELILEAIKEGNSQA